MKRLRLHVVALAVVFLFSGCALLQPILNTIRSDPAGSALVAVEEHTKKIREGFYDRDITAINECKYNAPDDAAVAECEFARCEAKDCRKWRNDIDPKLQLGYNVAVNAYEENAAGADTAVLIRSVAQQAIAGFRALNAIKPDSKYATAVEAIEAILNDWEGGE